MCISNDLKIPTYIPLFTPVSPNTTRVFVGDDDAKQRGDRSGPPHRGARAVATQVLR